MTRDEILLADKAQLNDWIDDYIMNDHKPYAGDYPDWSGDISAAWGVVEKLPLVQIEYVEIFEGNKEVNVNLWANGADLSGEPVRTTATTAPEAICKAALLAILEDPNEQ